MNLARITHQLGKQGLILPGKVIKRDGSQVAFDLGRIEKAITDCYQDLQDKGNIPSSPVRVITDSCAVAIAHRYGDKETLPSVEQIQDLVEVSLLTHNEVDAARAYMSYRDSHTKMRGGGVPEHVRAAFELDAMYFNTPMQRFAFYDKYSRFNWELGRRETWPETVDRTIDHLQWEVFHHINQEKAGEGSFTGYKGISATDLSTAQYSEFTKMPIADEIWERLRSGILEMRVMPSMRLLAMAGPAARRNSTSTYNCTFLPIIDIHAFVEILICSMSGSGVGFSVERHNIEQFPRVQRQLPDQAPFVHVVADSAQGWAETLRLGLSRWWAGLNFDWDLSLVRPAGSVLKTKGGRASGPEPLDVLLKHIKKIVLARQGTFITSKDAHYIACNVGEAAVQGGVRRSAMISLFDWDDQEMRSVKSFDFWNDPFHRVLSNANNSAVWPEDISDLAIMRQMTEMMFACSGEPGIFSRAAANKSMPEQRRNAETLWGVNPCGEVILPPFGMCNLSQAISRSGDTEEDLADKVELATILGTIQSLSTRFPGLRPEWKANCERERLLGVDLTAQNDCELLRSSNPDGAALRRRLKAHHIWVNEQYAELLGVNATASGTVNKPAGNSTGFIGASVSGIGFGNGAQLIRRNTVWAHTPQFRVLRECGVPMVPYAGFTEENAQMWWAEFLIKSPEGVPLARDTSAVEQLEFWLLNKLNWTTHNPSFTCTYRVHEMMDLVKWVCDHKEVIGGLSFLPASDTIYPILPMEEISEAEFNRRTAAFPEIDWSLLYQYEREDMSEASNTLACFAGQCEV